MSSLMVDDDLGAFENVNVSCAQHPKLFETDARKKARILAPLPPPSADSSGSALSPGPVVFWHGDGSGVSSSPPPFDVKDARCFSHAVLEAEVDEDEDEDEDEEDLEAERKKKEQEGKEEAKKLLFENRGDSMYKRLGTNDRFFLSATTEQLRATYTYAMQYWSECPPSGDMQKTFELMRKKLNVTAFKNPVTNTIDFDVLEMAMKLETLRVTELEMIFSCMNLVVTDSWRRREAPPKPKLQEDEESNKKSKRRGKGSRDGGGDRGGGGAFPEPKTIADPSANVVEDITDLSEETRNTLQKGKGVCTNMVFFTGFQNMRRRIQLYTHMLASEHRLALECRGDIEQLHLDHRSFLDPLDAFGTMSLKPDYHMLVKFLLSRALAQGLRRLGKHMYTQIMSPPLPCEGGPKRFPTCAWKRWMTIADWVKTEASQMSNETMWKVLTTASNEHKAVAYLESTIDPQLPVLNKSRYFFSFQNGLLWINAPEGVRFFRYTDGDVSSFATSEKYHDLPYNEALQERLRRLNGSSEVSVNNAWTDFLEIPTPSIDVILDAQLRDENPHIAGDPKEREAVKRIFYALFCGRLFYDLRQHDQLEIAPGIIGQGGAGKSTIMNAIMRCLSQESVGILANNANERFALQNLYIKKVLFCYEMTAKFGLDPAMWRNMVSGEGVTVQVKSKDDVQLPQWKAPLLIAGNQMSAQQDTGGNNLRRWLLFFVDFKIKEKDLGLDQRIRKELPYFLTKVCVAYRTFCFRFKKIDIWSESQPVFAKNAFGEIFNTGKKMRVIPKYFFLQRERLAALVHPVTEFLTNSEDLCVLPENRSALGMPFAVFSRMFAEYLGKGKSAETFKVTEETCKDKIADAGCALLKLTSRASKKYNGEVHRSGLWIEGVIDIKSLESISFEDVLPKSVQEIEVRCNLVDRARDHTAEQSEEMRSRLIEALNQRLDDESIASL